MLFSYSGKLDYSISQDLENSCQFLFVFFFQNGQCFFEEQYSVKVGWSIRGTWLFGEKMDGNFKCTHKI